MKCKRYIRSAVYTYAGYTCLRNYINITYSYTTYSNSGPHICMVSTLFTNLSP